MVMLAVDDLPLPPLDEDVSSSSSSSSSSSLTPDDGATLVDVDDTDGIVFFTLWEWEWEEVSPLALVTESGLVEGRASR